jgi:Ohr subfamily peroxiredoxin
VGASRGEPKKEDIRMSSTAISRSDVLYTAVATAENGRDGRVATDDGKLDVVVNPPKEMGGSGEGTNPEQLFAAGYSACFQGALGVVARNENADISGSTVTAEVGIGKNDDGFGLVVKISATIPNVDAETAKSLIEKAHQVCPYSKATRGNITVELAV